ncbi:hypothetical protein ACFVYF_06770 [Streptomyces sp. NPDC058274]|uniref:hypothetical protein n=1 Tax=Streptomyces sp. NPDC058274 TaxID=3346416 RepID=UPI0036EFFE5D
MHSKFRSRAVISGAAGYLAVQFWHTFRNRNTWPFCAYNMFNYDLPDRWHQFRVVLHDADGNAMGPTDPWCLLPVEFFRVVSILNKMFFGSADETLRSTFCERTLHLINESPWEDFDEVRASPVSPSAAPFVALDVYLVEVDNTCDAFDRSSVFSAELLHRHDPQGITAGKQIQWLIQEK